MVEIRQLHSDRRREGTANKETKRIMNKAARKRSRVRSLLREMYVWQCLGSTKMPDDVALTEAEIRLMYSDGSAPWATETSSLRAKQRYYGRLFHAASADLARLKEEEPLLRMEKARLLNWIKHVSDRVHAAIGAHEVVVASGGEQGAVARGKIFFLQQRIARMSRMSDEVAQRLSDM